MVLMEETALRVVEAVKERINLEKQKVAILVGSGNNGGDGIALREGSIGKPILVLAYTNEMEYPWPIENNITQTFLH